MSELIKNIPVVALRGMTILPSMITHFDISREKSVKAVEAAMLRDQRLVVLTQKSPETQDPGMKDLYKIGTLVTVKQIMKLPQNIFRVLAEGLERVEVMDLDVADGCLVADAATFSEEELRLWFRLCGPFFRIIVRRTVRSAGKRHFRSWNRRIFRKWWIRSL